MNINPYYGVIASGGGGSAASHFAGFPFAQCSDAAGFGGVDFYAKQYHHHHQNGAVHQLIKQHPASSVANGNNNNNGGLDAAAASEDGQYGRECNGKLTGYGEPIHSMPYPGYGDHGGPYRPGGDEHAAPTPSPHRPHQGLPPLTPRAQWSPPSSFVKGDTGTTASDPYKLSPAETAHHAASSTPATLGPPAAAFDAGDPVSTPGMSSPPPPSAHSCPARQPPPQQHCGHHQAIPYYPWMGVVGTYQHQ